MFKLLSKTNVVIFNKAGKCLKHPIYFNGTLIRSASLYRYLGFTISSSGKFNQCKPDLYKKSMKAYFKLQNCLSSTNPSIDTFLHLYDHTIKPILTYGSEIWGMFSVDSSSCREKNDYCFENLFSTSHTEQSHVNILKYILGVNRKTTNIAVMSELGRYPIYFSVILAMLKYCHRLEGQQEGLLFDAYICNKELHFSKINTWYSSILYIIDELKIRSLNIKLGQLCKQVKYNMCNSFLDFWNGERVDAIGNNRGKLDETPCK